MYFMITDKNFKRICTLTNAINIQWIQRWYSCGEFSIQLPAESTNITPEWHYIFCSERPNVGIIQQKIYTQNIKGKFLQISGFFMEHELSNLVITYDELKHSEDQYNTLYHKIGLMVKKYVEPVESGHFWYDSDMYFLPYPDNRLRIFGKYPDKSNGSYYFEVNNQDLMSAAFEMSKLNETSFIYTVPITDINNDNYNKNLTMLESKENADVVFTERHIKDFTITYDDSNYKNCVKVLGPVLNGIKYDAEIVSDEDVKRWIILDNSNMSLLDPEKKSDGTLDYNIHYTAETLPQVLKDAGMAELEKYQKVLNLDIQLNSITDYEYTKDYNVGEIITVKIESLGIEETKQIIEVSEVWKANKHEVYLELGESRQSTLDKAKRAMSKGSLSKFRGAVSNSNGSGSGTGGTVTFITTTDIDNIINS